MIKDYSEQTSGLHKDLEIKVKPQIIDHLHLWAKLNNQYSNSRKNWKEMTNGLFKNSLKDEGSLFKEKRGKII